MPNHVPDRAPNLLQSYGTGEADVTEADVLAAQKLWAESIASISKVRHSPSPSP